MSETEKVDLESVVIVHGEHGSTAAIHFSDPMQSCFLSSTRQLIYTRVEKKLKKVLNG